MVQFIPGRDDWGEAAVNFGRGATEGYMQRSDENAVKKAIMDLGPNPAAKDILNALTGARTYGNEAKQEYLKNYLNAENFELLKKKHQEARDLEREKFEEDKRAAQQLEQHREATLGLQQSKAQNAGKDIKRIEAIKTGLQTVDKMEKIGKEGRLGFGSHARSFVLGGKTSRDVGEYEQLGKSLIQLSSSIPIRNRQEFETLSEKLFDATVRDKEREGILEAMKHILTRSLAEEGVELGADLSGSKAIDISNRPSLSKYKFEKGK